MNKKKIVIIIGIFLSIGACFGARDKIVFQISLNRAHYYMENGNNEDAIKEYNSMIEKAPDVYELYVNKAILLAEMKDYDKALATFKEAEAINANDAELYYNMAHLYNLMGNRNLEEKCVDKAASLELKTD